MQPRELFEGLPKPPLPRAGQAIAQLGDGLVLRRATLEDAEALAAFNAVVHADPPDFEPHAPVACWTRELLDGRHPTCSPRDFLLVQDTSSGRIASSLCLLQHRLRYGDVSFDAGMPELVGTHPAYRHQGLVARQFEEIHAWSAERGQRLLLIDGIPGYYRQYGYELALEQNANRLIPAGALPAVEASGLRPASGGASGPRPASGEAAEVRPATGEDADWFERVYRSGSTRHRVSCLRDAAFWRFDLAGRDPGSARRFDFSVIEAGGKRLAMAGHVPQLIAGGWLVLNLLERDSAAWTSLERPVLRWLRGVGEELAARQKLPFRGVSLSLGTSHPFYDVTASRIATTRRPYAWYVRIPDLADFLRLVAPVLESHLATSPFAGFSGELVLDFYRSGVRLRLDSGRLVDVSPFRPATDERGQVGFPGHCFLSLLLGFKSLSQLRDAFPDCWVWDERRAPLVEALFPPQPSDLLPTS